MSQSYSEAARPVASAPADRYVKTKEIQDAVRGREPEVLDALGIDWRHKEHIRCPYPEHGGENDWRWDDKKAKAFCTCAAGDSIFNVVMKCEGVEFEPAKLRVAEIVGASHLIHQRRAGTSGIASDARSLLNPPQDQRDDSLVHTYLSHRLGIMPDAVPMPRSPVAGIRSLGYFEPPPKNQPKGEWKAVGHFPCAVFGMIGPDGRTHAHRIYLAPGGAGKADLGNNRAGHPRDPKKSAKLPDDGSTISGLGAIWGNPDTARTAIVCEGIETAAAAAYAFRVKVTAGEVLVVAAITAVGIEAFEPWPTCDLVVVGADRDDAGKNGRQPTRRGEKAARYLGMRLHERIEVRIALPGSPGRSVDWLDVLLEDGDEAVATGIRAAEKFVPTADELAARNVAREHQTEVEKAARLYPLPRLDLTVLQYGHTGNGKLRVFKVTEDERGNPVRFPIASPFGIVAKLRHLDRDGVYGLRIAVQGLDGQPKYIDFERSVLAIKGGEDIRAQILAAGLLVEGEGRNVVLSALVGADPDDEIGVVSRPGWHYLDDQRDPMFMTPGGTALGAPAGTSIELTVNARMSPGVAQAGSLSAWRAATTLAATTPGCEHWVLGLMAGFAGVVVDLTGIDTCGIDFTGLSSAGKTTAQRIAASVWSIPDASRTGSLFQSARSTDNALEAAAARANGTVLCLDEMAHVRGRDVAKIIYMIAGGAGKARMRSDATVRALHTWSTFAVLSGEMALEEKVTNDGGEWMAGMAVRILDVDVTDINRQVDAGRLQGIGEVRNNYGHAGPAFVQHLIDTGLHRRPDELRERIMRTGLALAGAGSDAAAIRAATPLAVMLVAAEIAKDAGLIAQEVQVAEAVAWAWNRFASSTNAEVLSPDDQATNALRTWIMSRWNVSVKNLGIGEAGGSSVREAEGWYDEDAVYIPKATLRDAAGGTMKETAVAAMLERSGGLHRRKGERRYVEYVPGLGRMSVYALSRQKFGLNRSAADPDASFTVVRDRYGDTRDEGDWRDGDRF